MMNSLKTAPKNKKHVTFMPLQQAAAKINVNFTILDVRQTFWSNFVAEPAIDSDVCP